MNIEINKFLMEQNIEFEKKIIELDKFIIEYEKNQTELRNSLSSLDLINKQLIKENLELKNKYENETIENKNLIEFLSEQNKNLIDNNKKLLNNLKKINLEIDTIFMDDKKIFFYLCVIIGLSLIGISKFYTTYMDCIPQ